MEKETQKDTLLADDLASLESYIHDLFHFSSLPICFISNIGVFLEVNPVFEEISKYKSYEIIGQPVEDLFKKGELDKLVKETFKKGSVMGKEMELIAKGGKKIDVQAFTKLRKNEEGDVVGYFFSPIDITEFKKREEKLKKKIEELKKKLKK